MISPGMYSSSAPKLVWEVGIYFKGYYTEYIFNAI